MRALITIDDRIATAGRPGTLGHEGMRGTGHKYPRLNAARLRPGAGATGPAAPCIQWR